MLLAQAVWFLQHLTSCCLDVLAHQGEEDLGRGTKPTEKKQKQGAVADATETGVFEQFDAKFKRAQAAQQRLERQAQEPPAPAAGARRGASNIQAQQPATQQGVQQMQEDDEGGRVRGSRKVGLPGQLKRIRLENFMCHECFEMEFGWVLVGLRLGR
jgi:hypothetical protein